MILPYLDLFGNEIFNAARTVAYLRNVYGARLSGMWELSADDPCNRLLYGLNGSGYPWNFTTPAADHLATGFPTWVDGYGLQPESEEFLGALITDIVGLSPTVSRTLTDKPVGGKLGNQRREPREITIKGYLVGSPCGIAYGVRWFNDYLRSAPCVNCQTRTFGFYKACPGNSAQWAFPDWDGYWQVFGAGLGKGMVTHPVHARDLTTGTIADAGCDLVEFEVTLIAGNPWLYKPASAVYSQDSGFIEFTLTAPPIGIDAIGVIWSNATTGSIDVDGVNVFSFADAPIPNLVEYNAALHTFTVDTFTDDILPPDGSQYITGIDPGFLFPWIETGECVTADQFVSINTGDSENPDDCYAVLYHREG